MQFMLLWSIIFSAIYHGPLITFVILFWPLVGVHRIIINSKNCTLVNWKQISKYSNMSIPILTHYNVYRIQIHVYSWNRTYAGVYRFGTACDWRDIINFVWTTSTVAGYGPRGKSQYAIQRLNEWNNDKRQRRTDLDYQRCYLHLNFRGEILFFYGNLASTKP